MNWELLAGVTTNPSLVAKEKDISFHDRLREITAFVPGSVSAEVIALDAEGMIREGKEISSDCSKYHGQSPDDSGWHKGSSCFFKRRN